MGECVSVGRGCGCVPPCVCVSVCASMSVCVCVSIWVRLYGGVSVSVYMYVSGVGNRYIRVWSLALAEWCSQGLGWYVKCV